MVTAAKIGHGFQFSIGDSASPEAFTAVKELLTLQAPGIQRDAVEVTNTDSANKYREFITGLTNGGQVNLTGNLLKEHLDTMNTEQAKTASSNYRITLPTDTAVQLDFAAMMTDFNTDEPVDAAMTFNMALQITGPITIT